MAAERPPLNKQLDRETFRSYYYLKEELIDFCRANGLSASGGKIEITDRIAHYLNAGEALPAKRATKARPAARPTGPIDEDTLIEENFVCSEVHRAFFKERLGKGFSFNVAFQKWLKANAGKTYAQAIEAYGEIIREKKQGKTVIDRQFEYNTYIRAFFADNPGKPLENAIKCWKYKKGQPGHNRYEKADLLALES